MDEARRRARPARPHRGPPRGGRGRSSCGPKPPRRAAPLVAPTARRTARTPARGGDAEARRVRQRQLRGRPCARDMITACETAPHLPIAGTRRFATSHCPGVLGTLSAQRTPCSLERTEAGMGLMRLLPRPTQARPPTRRKDTGTRSSRSPTRRAASRRRRRRSTSPSPSRSRAPRARRRPRPAGQPDDEPGDEPGRDRALDVRRARPPAADRGDHPRTPRSTSPSRRSTSPAPSSRCRA